MNDQPFGESFVQASRLLRIETPLGEDALLLERFEGREAVNELFSFKATVRAKRDDVKPQDLIGRNVQISMALGEGGPRRQWDCLVTGYVEQPRLSGGLRQYTLVLHADHWFMTQRSDSRIWQNMTSLEVAETLFSEHGLRGPDTSGVLGDPPKRGYSVQWQETDLAYLLRRVEEDGLFYWVRQTAEGQQFVLADSAMGWDAGADGESGATRFALGSTDKENIAQWDRHVRFTPGKRAGRDWNFETPNTVPGADAPSLVELPRNGAYELYEYPARAQDNATSERALKLRMQSVEADHERIEANSSARVLAPGAKVTPYDLADADNVFETAVVLAIEHVANATTFETGGEHPEYQNRFQALPAHLPATPHRATPKPKIAKTQIAIVAGPPGEEIHTDQYGRIKLWFPWDRRAKKDGSDTTWARCIQSWGGGQWGQQVIPRIGMEVAVTYVDDDPDRPLVVGVVPNPVNKVPYDLPANKTRMTLRSNTHKGEGFNELSMEDEAGRENVFLHAQKDMTQKVLNNQTSRVDANALHSVGASHSLEIGSNMSQQVGGGLNMVVGGVGSLVNAIAGGVLGGLAVRSAGLLQQAMSTVAAATADRPSSADRNAEAAAAASNVDGPRGAGSTAGEPGPVSQAAGYAGLMASGQLGIMASALDAIRGGVNDSKAGELRGDAGDAMRQSGGQLGSQVASMVGQGVFNTLVSRMQNTSVGVAQTEQVGVAKVVTVGEVYNQTVGHSKSVTIGKELFVGVGGGTDADGNPTPPKSILLMKDDGTIVLRGVRIFVEAESHIQLIAPMIDNN